MLHLLIAALLLVSGAAQAAEDCKGRTIKGDRVFQPPEVRVGLACCKLVHSCVIAAGYPSQCPWYNYPEDTWIPAYGISACTSGCNHAFYIGAIQPYIGLSDSLTSRVKDRGDGWAVARGIYSCKVDYLTPVPQRMKRGG